MKNVGFAVFLSLVVPGLGQIYNEDLWKGFFLIVGSLICFFFFGLGYVILWLFAIVEAYLRARALNSQKGARS